MARDAATNDHDQLLNKVPLVTLGFWIVKICATTVGETGGDALSMTLNFGYAVSSLIFLVFFLVTVAAQVSAKRYHPLIYWLVVVATTTVGTTTSDYLDRTLGLGYVKSSFMLLGLVIAILVAWRMTTGSIAVNHITSKKNEAFYWVTILVSNTLGTALGDFTADSLGFGFQVGALIFAGLIAVVALLYFFTKIPDAILFWAAYILTRPLGATLGDTLTKPLNHGGLDLGRFSSTFAIAAVMVVIVFFTHRRRRAAEFEGFSLMRLHIPFGALGVALLCMTASAQAAAPAYHVADRIAGPDGGWDYVRVDAKTHQVLVTRGATVMAVNTLNGKVDPTFAQGARLHIAMPIGDGTEVVMTNGGSDTAVFANAATGKVLATVPTGKGPDAAAYDARSGTVLVIDHVGGDVILIDGKTHRKLGAIAVGGELEESVVDGKGRAFVNVESKNEIAVLDLARRSVTARYPLPGCDGPTGLAYDAKDGLLIAACDGATVLVNAATGKLIQTLPTGKGADGVAFDPARRLVFVPAGRDGAMAVIALANGHGRIVQQLETRKSARTIGIDERTGRLYLPSAEYLPAVGGARPQAKPGSFRLLVVAP